MDSEREWGRCLMDLVGADMDSIDSELVAALVVEPELEMERCWMDSAVVEADTGSIDSELALECCWTELAGAEVAAEVVAR